MNTTAKTFLVSLASVAAAAATGVALANHTAAPATEVVKLERVVITVKRAEPQFIAQLPRVVIEGRRDATMLAAVQAPVWIV